MLTVLADVFNEHPLSPAVALSEWMNHVNLAFAALTGYDAAIKDTAQQNEDSYEAKNHDNAED